MYTDKIIADVWSNRESYVDEHHHDMNEIIEDLIKRQNHTNRTVVSRYNNRIKAEFQNLPLHSGL